MSQLWSHPCTELSKMTDIVLRTKKTYFLEIGCFKFGMCSHFLAFSSENPCIIGNDIRDQWSERRELLQRQYERSFHFVLGDSQDPATIAKIKKILGPNKLDILFIDGGHSNQTVERDTVNYVPLVAPEGYIIWHDMKRSERVHLWLVQQFMNNIHLNTFFEGDSKIAYVQKKEWDRMHEFNKNDKTPTAWRGGIIAPGGHY